MSRWDPQVSDLVLALRDRLDEDDMTLRKAGDVVGASPTTIMNWAKGTVGIKLNADTQQGLATLLGTSPRRVLELAGFDLGSGRATSSSPGSLETAS